MDNCDMPEGNGADRIEKVAVIGGGPAGAFFSIHLLRRARELGRKMRVVIIERRLRCGNACGGDPSQGWKECGYCAGGISPKLNDALECLGMQLPPEIIQGHLQSITIQGYWKNIELEIPPGRKILSVFRGARPLRRVNRQHNFDAFLLDCALKEGAELIGGEVYDAGYSAAHKPIVRYRDGRGDAQLEIDFVVFAGGVNASDAAWRTKPPLLQVMQRMIPDYVPPQVRKTLVFELETPPGMPTGLEGELHFVEYGSKALRLEMCSLLPKQGYITVVLIGPAVDRATGPAENLKIIRQFLALPHISQLLSARAQFRPVCTCNPRLTIGLARNPFGEGVAGVGDLVVSRLYKDGILSAQQTACALAETLLTRGGRPAQPASGLYANDSTTSPGQPICAAGVSPASACV